MVIGIYSRKVNLFRVIWKERWLQSKPDMYFCVPLFSVCLSCKMLNSKWPKTSRSISSRHFCHILYRGLSKPRGESYHHYCNFQSHLEHHSKSLAWHQYCKLEKVNSQLQKGLDDRPYTNHWDKKLLFFNKIVDSSSYFTIFKTL